jgi:alginate O-acetyltransferase complex protein AlgI
MLFNSYEFLFAFLPVTLVLLYVLGARSTKMATAWLAIASLFFYSFKIHEYIFLLLASVTFNFFMGMFLSRRFENGSPQSRKALMIAGVGGNLLLLGYFKYAIFSMGLANDVLGTSFALPNIILPIGISFYTFTQIAFLVDCSRGEVKEYNFLSYLLFVTYFPHLIAGPILHHKEMMQQFESKTAFKFCSENMSVGLTILAIGLLKKCIFADGIAPHADSFFNAANTPGFSPDLISAWIGALCYTLQLYFDFSGYSDMAIGLSRMCGVSMPINFNSPYKSLSIIDFWRRWHLTLSRFLRDYLYIALGGNRKGEARRHINLFLTMLLGGLWHGAATTFVVWGALHGAYLIINHFWRGFAKGAWTKTTTYRSAAWLVTFIAVVIAWVFFRATNLDAAGRILAAMAGHNGVAIPVGIALKLGLSAAYLKGFGVGIAMIGSTDLVKAILWILVLLLIATRLPNTQNFMRKWRHALGQPDANEAGKLYWMPTRTWACFTAILLLAAILSLAQVSNFLYFQF